MKINIDWLKEKDFDDKYYTRAVFVGGTYTLNSWTDEKDIMEIMRLSRLQQLELRRYYSPSHARWINDDAHKVLAIRVLEALEKDGPHQASREAQKKRAQKCLNCDDIGAFTKSVKCQHCGACPLYIKETT